MAKTNTIPVPQSLKVASAYWTNASSLMQKILQFNGADYSTTNDAEVVSLVIINNTAATASVFGVALIDPSQTLPDTQSGTLTSGATTCTGLSDTTLLMMGWGVSGTGIAAGTYISAIGSSTAITLSKNATASGAQTLTFTPHIPLGQVNVVAESGGDNAGAIASVDFLNNIYVAGLPNSPSSQAEILLPAGFKICAWNLTAPAANTGGFTVTAMIKDYTA